MSFTSECLNGALNTCTNYLWECASEYATPSNVAMGLLTLAIVRTVWERIQKPYTPKPQEIKDQILSPKKWAMKDLTPLFTERENQNVYWADTFDSEPQQLTPEEFDTKMKEKYGIEQKFGENIYLDKEHSEKIQKLSSQGETNLGKKIADFVQQGHFDQFKWCIYDTGMLGRSIKTLEKISMGKTVGLFTGVLTRHDLNAPYNFYSHTYNINEDDTGYHFDPEYHTGVLPLMQNLISQEEAKKNFYFDDSVDFNTLAFANLKHSDTSKEKLFYKEISLLPFESTREIKEGEVVGYSYTPKLAQIESQWMLFGDFDYKFLYKTGEPVDPSLYIKKEPYIPYAFTQNCKARQLAHQKNLGHLFNNKDITTGIPIPLPELVIDVWNNKAINCLIGELDSKNEMYASLSVDLLKKLLTKECPLPEHAALAAKPTAEEIPNLTPEQKKSLQKELTEFILSITQNTDQVTWSELSDEIEFDIRKPSKN